MNYYTEILIDLISSQQLPATVLIHDVIEADHTATTITFYGHSKNIYNFHSGIFLNKSQPNNEVKSSVRRQIESFCSYVKNVETKINNYTKPNSKNHGK